MEVRKGSRLKVADMISVFDKDQPKPATAGTTLPSSLPVHKTKQNQSNVTAKETRPQVSAHTDSDTKRPFKMIQVSGSGQVIDENDARCSRTLGHFKTAGINCSITTTAITKTGQQAIKPMAYQPPSYSSKKTSAPITLRNSSSIPRSKTFNDSLSTQSSLRHSRSPSPPPPSLNTLTVKPEKHAGGVYYRREKSKPVTDSKDSSSRAHLSSSSKSVSASKIPTVRTWDKMNVDSSTVAKPTASVQRSRSFTSHVTVEVSTTSKRRHRSSLVLDIGDGSMSDESGRSKSAMAGSVSDGPESPSLVLKNFLDAQTAVRQQERSIVLSDPISIEVNRIVTTFSSDEKQKKSPPLAQKKFPPPTAPKPISGNNNGRGAYKTMPSRVRSATDITSLSSSSSPSKAKQKKEASPNSTKASSSSSAAKGSSPNHSPSKLRKPITDQTANKSSLSFPRERRQIREKSPVRVRKEGTHAIRSPVLTSRKIPEHISKTSSFNKTSGFISNSSSDGNLAKQASGSASKTSPSGSPSLLLRRTNKAVSPPTSVKSRIALFQSDSTVPRPRNSPWAVAQSSSLPRNTTRNSTRPKSVDASEQLPDRMSTKHSLPSLQSGIQSKVDNSRNNSTPPTQRRTANNKVTPPTPPPKPRKTVSMVTAPTVSPPTQCNEGDEGDSGDEEPVRRTRLRIQSEQKSENEDDIIEVSTLQPQVLDLTTPFQDTPTFEYEMPESEYDDVVFDNKPNLPLAGGDDENVYDDVIAPKSSIYSYQEYAMARKLTRSSVSGSSVSSESNMKPLAAIPEDGVSLLAVTSQDPENEEEESQLKHSDDSEAELLKRVSRISGTFYEEMIDSIAKLAHPETREEGALTCARVQAMKKQLSAVVDDMVRKDPQLVEQADGLYESLEEYGRKVSDYLQQCNNRTSEDEQPPELPPRPDFLLRLIGGEQVESPNILKLEGYEEMHTSEQPAGGEYEPIFFINQEVVKSPKKKRKSSKLTFKRKSPEHSSSPPPPVIAEREEEPVQRTRKMSKMKWIKFGRSVKIEPTNSLPMSLRTCSVSSQSINETCQEQYEEMHRPDSTPPHMYVNVGGIGQQCSSLSPSHTYDNVGRQVSGSHGDLIEPTYSSESDNETEDLCSQSFDSQSPIKKRWRDKALPTPDSGVFAEEHHEQCRRHAPRDHMTPPLVTKLAVKPTPPIHHALLRMSISDPSLHSTSLQVVSGANQKPNPSVSPSHSPCLLSQGNLSLDSMISDIESTPSVCSFDSNRFNVSGVELKFFSTPSPAMRKRIRSDASMDRVYGSSRRGAEQKAQFLKAQQKRKRRGSVSSASEVNTTEGVIEVPLVYADALMDCTGLEPDHLSFKVNDVIAVLDMRDDDWWQGIVEDRIGWFSASWVRLRIDQEGGDNSSFDQDSDSVDPNGSLRSSQLPDSNSLPSETAAEERPPVTNESTEHDTVPDLAHIEPSRRHSIVMRRKTIRKRDSGDLPRSLLPAEIRAKCIEEILNTEKVYVQHLQDIVEGFLYSCQERKQLFDEERVETIFSNIEDIYRFQCEFLKQLESRINTDNLGDSLIGEVFVSLKDKFAMYSEYCNNHPHAVNEMNLLHQDQQYNLFFEGCRLLRNMTNISLEGFLLNPVQRICRYPLQLSELVKYTPESHPDYPHVVAAQESMTQVAVLINERKRRMEALARVWSWQESVENWKDSDLLERSTELIHQGELHKISKGHSQERHFFLFDRQLVYCKKDTIGGKLSYKGRFDMDRCEIIDLKDNELIHGGNGLKNAWKINNVDKNNKWYVLFAKTTKTKQEWTEAFKRERSQVHDDENDGFKVTPKMKRAAIAIFNASSEPIGRKHHQPRKSHAADWLSESIPASLTLPRVKADMASSLAVSKNSNYSPVEKKRKLKRK